MRYKARFVDIYDGPNNAGHTLWSFSAELEMLERPLPPKGEGLFPEDIIYSELLDLTINREWPKA